MYFRFETYVVQEELILNESMVIDLEVPIKSIGVKRELTHFLRRSGVKLWIQPDH